MFSGARGLRQSSQACQVSNNESAAPWSERCGMVRKCAAGCRAMAWLQSLPRSCRHSSKAPAHSWHALAGCSEGGTQVGSGAGGSAVAASAAVARLVHTCQAGPGSGCRGERRRSRQNQWRLAAAGHVHAAAAGQGGSVSGDAWHAAAGGGRSRAPPVVTRCGLICLSCCWTLKMLRLQPPWR